MKRIDSNENISLFYDVFITKFGYLSLIFKEDNVMVGVVLPCSNKDIAILETRKFLEKKGFRDYDNIKQKSSPFRSEFKLYFEKKNKNILRNLDSDLDFFKPTSFQKRVWLNSVKIEKGETMTYKELSDKISTNSYRAVGNALGKNPLPLIIPCHRVVSKNGFGGFSAHGGVSMKQKLLLHERNLRTARESQNVQNPKSI